MMEQHVEKLLKRLSFLGYCAFELKSIIQEATSKDNLGVFTPNNKAIRVLEKYEKLGSDYLLAYSK